MNARTRNQISKQKTKQGHVINRSFRKQVSHFGGQNYTNTGDSKMGREHTTCYNPLLD